MDLKERLARLAEIAALKDGWLGNSPVPSKTAIANARQLLIFLADQGYFDNVSLFPLETGGVEMVLMYGDKVYEVEYQN